MLGAAPTLAARPVLSYSEQLALKGRTLLYEAPSHFWFRFGCYTAATMCFAYVGYNHYTILLHPPDGLMWWIPYTFGLVLVFVAAVGFWFVMSTGKIVRSIETVPAAAVAKELAARAAKAASNKSSTAAPLPASPIYIEVLTRRPIPFAPFKRILLHPEEVQMPFRMNSIHARAARENGPPAPQTLREKVRAERAARDKKAADRKYTMDHLLTAPFRDGARAFGAATSGITRAFTRGGFATIRLNRKKYKMDVMGGWALDEGRAMDRLMPVAPLASGERV